MAIGRRRFRILKEIAEGGFGKVYLAEQISSDGFSRIVAVKLLHAKWSNHEEVVKRTRDEARLLGLIRHQHIVKVEDLTAIDGKCAIVMEYLEGVDLKWMITFLKDRGLEFPRAALFEIMLGVALALDAAYNGTPLQGGDALMVIHRDIKPSNVFLTVAGGVKVLDFGTARANFVGREAKTQALAFGSQGYMAPERLLGEEDTPAADIFSLGVSLYELLTGESFGRVPPRPNKFIKKLEERVTSVPLDGDPEWCETVRDTLRLMLSYEPKDRPSASQLVEIMEMLAQDAKDMGLRRFCRTLVAEAKANLPDLDSGDPLVNTLVDEDASASFGVANVEELISKPSDTKTVVARRPHSPTLAPSLGSDSGEFSDVAPAKSTPTDEAPANGNALMAMGAGVGVVSVVAGIAILLALLLVGLWWSSNNPSGEGAGGEVTTNPAPKVDIPPEKKPDEPVQPEKAKNGIIHEDGRDVARIPTTLTFGTESKVTIGGPSGFRAEWDGKEPLVLDLGFGRYGANFLIDDELVRSRFMVSKKAKACKFSFDATKKKWDGDCK